MESIDRKDLEDYLDGLVFAYLRDCSLGNMSEANLAHKFGAIAEIMNEFGLKMSCKDAVLVVLKQAFKDGKLWR